MDRSHEKAREGEAAAVWVKVERLSPWVKNPRRNDQAVDKVAESIRAFGFGAPLLARQDTGELIAGHTRLKAALKLGLKTVPVRYLDLDEVRAHALALADNRAGEEAEWDREALARVLQEIRDADEDALQATAFDEKEVESLLGALEAERLANVEEDLDEDLLALPTEPKSAHGGIYQLGPHVLVCGDSTCLPDVELACAGRRPDMLFTDPPYNVAYEGKTKDALTIENDKMSPEQFRDFLRDVFASAFAVCRDGAAWYVAAPPGPDGLAFGAALHDLGVWRQKIAWVKDVFVLGHSDYHYRHEDIFYGWKPGSHQPMPDRKQDSVWEIPRPKASREHPTMKPVALVRRAIANSSRHGDLVLDLFGGSGTTMIAAAKEQRVAALVELDPKYCDVIRRRWARFALKAGLEVGDGLVGDQVPPAGAKQDLELPTPIEHGGPPSRLPN